jgi:hypothetical protein
VANVEESAVRVESSTSDIKDATMNKIKRMLDRSNNKVNEAEARIALMRARQHMRRLHIEEDEVLSHAEGRSDNGGISTVAIRRRDGNKNATVMWSAWIGDLAYAIKLFFAPVKCFTKRRQALMEVKNKAKKVARTAYIEINFYGIVENTVAAAHAFEMAYNLIALWAMDQKPNGKLSYCRGVCETIRQDALRAQEQEEVRAVETAKREMARRVRVEEEERQAQIARLRMPSLEDQDGKSTRS